MNQSGVQRMAYTALLIIMFGVCTGWLGGL